MQVNSNGCIKDCSINTVLQCGHTHSDAIPIIKKNRINYSLKLITYKTNKPTKQKKYRPEQAQQIL